MECSLSQRLPQVFQNLYDQCFPCDTPVFQQLFTEFGLLENSHEVEIATKFIMEREKFLFHRFEYAILSSLEAFYVALAFPGRVDPSVSDNNYADIIKRLWH
jgi:hypothetical protein